MGLYYFNTSNVRRAVPESMEGGWCFNEAIETYQSGNTAEFGEVGSLEGQWNWLLSGHSCLQF